jgi:hypothetical protein
VELEEDKFIVGFHQQVQKEQEKAYHERHTQEEGIQERISGIGI